MNKDFLQERIERLYAQYSCEPEGIKDRVIFVYYRYVLLYLKELFVRCSASDAVLLDALEAFLAENWDVVKHTALCYTALPESEITALLCDVARFIVAHKTATEHAHPMSLVPLLMPGVVTESTNPDAYPDLAPVPGAVFEPLDMKTLFQTHILGRRADDTDACYLLPIALLLGQEVHEALVLHNPYYDYRAPGMAKEADFAVLSADELSRIEQHSASTKTLLQAKKNYERLVHDENTLLGSMRLLCQQLYEHSVHGMGEELDASGGAYPAILHFREYYHRLGQEMQERIPPAVKEEIDLLLRLSFDPTSNSAAEEQLETCIATRHMHLARVMRLHEAELYAVRLDGPNKEALLSFARAEYARCVNALKEALIHKTYQGCDALAINPHLLETFDIDYQIKDLEACGDFMELSAAEIKSLGALPDVQEQFIEVLGGLDELILCTLACPAQKIQALWEVMGLALTHAFIHTREDVISLIGVLDRERCAIVCDVLKDESTYLLFVKSYKGLEAEKQQMLLEVMRDQWSALIHSASEWMQVMRALDEAPRDVLYALFIERLPEFIDSAQAFQDVFLFLSEEQSEALLPKIDAQIPTFITCTDDLEVVLPYLTQRYRVRLLQALAPQWPQMLGEIDDFTILFDELIPEEYPLVYPHIRECLPGIIHTARDFSSVCDYLNQEQRAYLVDALQGRWPDIIRSAVGLRTVCAFLTPEQCNCVVGSLTGSWYQLISSVDYFEKAFHLLAPEHHALVLEEIKKRVPRFVRTVSDLGRILAKISPIQRGGVCALLRNCWPRIITSLDDVLHVFAYLSEAQRGAVFVKINKLVLPLVCTIDDYHKLFSCLSVVQINQIINSKKQAIIMYNQFFSLFRYPHLSHDEIWHSLLLKSILESQPQKAGAIVSMFPHLLTRYYAHTLFDASGREFLSGDPYPRLTALKLIYWLKEPMHEWVVACVPNTAQGMLVREEIEVQKNSFKQQGLSFTLGGVVHQEDKGFTCSKIIHALKHCLEDPELSIDATERTTRWVQQYGQALYEAPTWMVRRILGAELKLLVFSTEPDLRSEVSWYAQEDESLRLGRDYAVFWIGPNSAYGATCLEVIEPSANPLWKKEMIQAFEQLEEEMRYDSDLALKSISVFEQQFLA